jgi:hypothetical protein
MNDTAVRHSETLQVRCPSEIVNRIEQAAKAKYMRPAEYIRRALISHLAADGMLPAERETA